MFVFFFVLSCLVFISTITWLSYQLGEAKSMNPKQTCAIGFVLSFMPPMALVYVLYLAFKPDTRVY